MKFKGHKVMDKKDHPANSHGEAYKAARAGETQMVDSTPEGMPAPRTQQSPAVPGGLNIPDSIPNNIYTPQIGF